MAKEEGGIGLLRLSDLIHMRKLALVARFDQPNTLGRTLMSSILGRNLNLSFTTRGGGIYGRGLKGTRSANSDVATPAATTLRMVPYTAADQSPQATTSDSTFKKNLQLQPRHLGGELLGKRGKGAPGNGHSDISTETSSDQRSGRRTWRRCTPATNQEIQVTPSGLTGEIHSGFF